MTNNPFQITSYIGPQFFCDREEETAEIINAIENERSLTIHSMRRLGKTGLIHHVFHKLPKKKYLPIYIDIYDVITANDLVNKLCSKVIGEIEREQNGFVKKVNSFFGRYKPSFSIDTFTGSPVVSLDINTDDEIRITLDTLFTILKEQSKIVVLAIDEFQQINQFSNKTIPATFRKYLQELTNLVFIFSGSQNNILLEMMASPKKALFRSTQLLPLGKIKTEKYEAFITFHFKQGLRSIDNSFIKEGIEWTMNHTFYTQYFFNRLYGKNIKKIKKEDVTQIKYEILKENEAVFLNYRNLLTNPQWKLLKAIAKENEAREPTSKKFLKTYDLGSNSTVQRSLKFLLDKEMIYKVLKSDDSKPSYFVYDVFLSRWLERL